VYSVREVRTKRFATVLHRHHTAPAHWALLSGSLARLESGRLHRTPTYTPIILAVLQSEFRHNLQGYHVMLSPPSAVCRLPSADIINEIVRGGV